MTLAPLREPPGVASWKTPPGKTDASRLVLLIETVPAMTTSTRIGALDGMIAATAGA
jgi:hypothetical protein